MSSSVRLHICLLVGLLLAGFAVKAGNNPEYRATLFGRNGALVTNGQISVSDLNFQAYKNTSGAIEQTYYVKNAIRLMMDEESTWYAQSDFSCTVNLSITTENAAGSTSSFTKSLTLDYKKGQGLVSGAITSYEFKDAVGITATISSISSNVAWDVTKNLKLVGEIISLRDWGFNCSASISGITTDSLFSDEWKIIWGVPANFQTEYDLEWAWIDESAVADYTVSGNVDMNLVFDNNATRVSTTNNYYRIPLLYEGDGRLYARVRMAQKKVNGQRVEGNWFYHSYNSLAYLPRTSGHEDNFNWQATTTFAEEGKRKTVIQYFDGTLRGRQTVTKDNVTQKTVVAESFYDYQGRPVIQVLPAPTLNTAIGFSRNFNQFDDARNAKTVYDKLDVNQSACNKLTAKLLSTATGSASQYYSPQNPLVNDGFNKFIPDAEGYPYLETRYTADGTGHIDAQGGVGKLFQVNSDHETKYFYESADQDDLDALFGTDAGYASHYSKTWVRDANGQYSVSYVDMKGKRIATALAGDSVAALKALPSFANATKHITRQLIDPETNNVHGNSIIASKSLMVAKAGNFQFNYYLSPEKLKMMLCTNTEFCFDCLYELNISIIPDCSDKTIDNFTNPVVKKNFNLGQYLTSCAGTQSPLLDTIFTVWLKEGSYTVVKELKLSTAARDWYRENVYLANDTCKRKIDFITQQYSLALSQQNCYTTCAQCSTKLGTKTDFINRFKQESGLSDSMVTVMMPQIVAAYDEAKANCDRLCDNDLGESTDELAAIKDIMLQDMTPPMGQYARRNDSANPAYENMPYNIFNTAPLVSLCAPQSGLRAPYRYPVDYNAGAGTVSCAPGYRNDYGIVNLPIADLQRSSYDQDSLIDNFEDGYAYSLLYYHPEFCKLKRAETYLKGTYRFAGRIQNTETFSQAITRGFINPSLTNATQAADLLLQKDSFFILVGSSSSYYTDMRNAIISNYVAASPACSTSQSMGMWRLAQLTVFCYKEMKDNSTAPPNGGCSNVSLQYMNCYNSLGDLPPLSWDHCEADLNMVWKNFKAFYLSFRNILVSRYLSNNCTVNSSLFNPNNGFNYQERFTTYSSAPPYTVQNVGDLTGLLGEHPKEWYEQQAQLQADSICMANTGNWMSRLRRCPQVDALALSNPGQWASDSAWLSKYLVRICSPGVDFMGHPFGAASLPDGKPAIEVIDNPGGGALNPVKLVRSFPELITYYLNYRSISISAYCYPELVDFPRAYNNAPPTVSTPIVTAPEPCVCERINYFKTKWQNAGSPGTFSTYLASTHGTVIGQDTLDLLLNMCSTGYTSTNPNCNYLTAPLKLPAIFQCRGTANLDSSKTCISCADYKEIKLAFKAERNVDAPIDNPQTTAEVALNQAFQDFANYRTGFSKLWTEYVAFGQLCPNDSGYTCKELTNLLNQYNATQHPDTGAACRNAFVMFMNNATGHNYTFTQWMDEFIKACGAQPPVCQAVLTCTGIRSLVNSYYLHYGFQIWRNSNCQQLFTNFVNDSLGTSYTYAEIVNKYNFLCGVSCPLNVCGFPNSHLLTLLYNTYKATVYEDPKNLEDCQQKFTDWFNEQLGFDRNPYTWQQIVGMYQMYSIDCTPDLNQLCMPPYSCSLLNEIIVKFHILYPPPVSDCETVFTEFFNSKLGTNYTYQQIALIYSTVCHATLDVCGGSTDGGWNCTELKLLTQTFNCTGGQDPCVCFVNTFNTHFGTSYTYQQIKDIYKKYCDYILNICPPEQPVFTCEQLQQSLKQFYEKYPGGAATLGANCQVLFAAFFNGQHATQLTYAQIADQYLVVCGVTLDVCGSKCTEYSDFVTKYLARYGSMQLYIEARRQLFTFMFNKAFGFTNGSASTAATAGSRSTAVSNYPLTYDEIKAMLNPCSITMGTLEDDTQIIDINSAQTLKDFKTAYYLMHPSGMPADCRNDYTAWFNNITGTTWTFNDLATQYNTYVGMGAGDICGLGITGLGDGATMSVIEAAGRGSLPQIPPMLCGLNVEIYNPPPVDTSTCKDSYLLALSDANIKYELYLDSLRRNFDVAWYKKCTKAKDLESFTVTYDKAEYHYTLYYYDQAGQLVRTVPPEGVDDRRDDNTFLADVKTKRANVKAGQSEASNIKVPSHRLATDYRYNTLGQVVQQKTPDGGISDFWYDILGRMAVSQNAQQKIDGKFSYTVYDALGRTTEVGQKPQDTTMTEVTCRNIIALHTWLNNTSDKEQITRTVYDVSYFNGDDILKPELLYQRNLRNRVSYMQVFDAQPSSYIGTHRAATYYTYDIHGNVDTLLQDYGNSTYYSNVMSNNGNRYKKMAYDYDLISAKVNMITYQPGYYNPQTHTWVTQPDRFYHRYVYDAENKITDVYTSHDSLVWEQDARYIYYRHGVLARMVLGQQQVQGIDYAYTLQGWTKGVNSTAISDYGDEGCASGTAKDILDVYTRQQFGAPSIYTARQQINFQPGFDHDPGDNFETIINASLNPCVPVVTPTAYANGDMGQDGKSGSANQYVSRDAYSFSLNYYQVTSGGNTTNDYKGINTSSQPFSSSGMFKLDNIDGNKVAKPLFNGNIASMFVNIPKLGNPNLYAYEYDQLSRFVGMDAFGGFSNSSNGWINGTPTPTDNYKERVTYDANGNILSYLRNGTTNGGPQAMDNLTYAYNKDGNNMLVNNRLRHIKDAVASANYQEDLDSQPDDNYTYDASGKLIKDTQEGITNITWTVYGRIASVTKATGTIKYTYDAAGNRQSKVLNGDTTWYVRNATGNVMAIYERRASLNSNHLTQTEIDLFGSSRIGTYNINRDMLAAAPGEITSFERGRKVFELNNHLSNVLVTVSDRKLQVQDAVNTTQTAYYTADVVTANDYYPFGMTMAGRKFANSTNHRYGFNGKEKDNNIAAEDYDFGARIYDARIGRWLSADPMEKLYPSLTPYNFVSNVPLSAVDPDGKLIIFIGGLRLWKGPGDQPRSPMRKGKKGIYSTDVYDYWSSTKNSFGRTVSMSQKFIDRIGDNNVVYTSGSAEWRSSANTRMKDGMMRALQFHLMVQSGQIKLDKDETIKIVTHSQGGAHGDGFVKGLQVLNIMFGTNYKVEVVYNITPHQPTKIDLTNKNYEKSESSFFGKETTPIRQVQYSHSKDNVSSADPAWLPNGGSKFGRMGNVTEFDGRNVMCDELLTYRGMELNPHTPGPGQIHSTGATGNRGGHNVYDNDFIFDIKPGEQGYVAPRKDKPKK